MNIIEKIINQKQIRVSLNEDELSKIVLDAVVKEANITKNYTGKVYISNKSSNTRGSIPYAEVNIDVDL